MDPSRTCVCQGGDLNPCSGCTGETILLLDGFYVPVDECPWVYNYTQESYLVEAYNHYQNGHLLYPSIGECPGWLIEGITYLNRIEIERHEQEMEEAKRQRQK